MTVDDEGDFDLPDVVAEPVQEYEAACARAAAEANVQRAMEGLPPLSPETFDHVGRMYVWERYGVTLEAIDPWESSP